MKKKIIHMLCHTLNNDDTLLYHVFGGFPSRLAKNISHYTDKFENEVWYPVNGLKKYETKKKDGILYRLFPAKTLAKSLESFYGLIDCPELFQMLEKEDRKKTIIHFQGERGSILHTLLSSYNFKVILQYHGYGQPKILDWIERVFITPLERKNFPKIRHFYVPIKPRVNYLQDVIGVKKNKISFENSGVDYAIFRPISQQKARKELNIPLYSFVIIYIGSMVHTKGVDTIISAYDNLKKKYPHLYLLLIGAKKTDPLYEMARKHADKLIEVTENKLLPYFYNSADVYCFYGTEKTIRFAGPGVTTQEALACNLNVISTNLYHFPDKIVHKVGFIPSNYTDFVKKIEFLITHPRFKCNGRKLVENYVSNRIILTNIVKKYDEI